MNVEQNAEAPARYVWTARDHGRRWDARLENGAVVARTRTDLCGVAWAAGIDRPVEVEGRAATIEAAQAAADAYLAANGCVRCS